MFDFAFVNCLKLLNNLVMIGAGNLMIVSLNTKVSTSKTNLRDKEKLCILIKASTKENLSKEKSTERALSHIQMVTITMVNSRMTIQMGKEYSMV